MPIQACIIATPLGNMRIEAGEKYVHLVEFVKAESEPKPGVPPASQTDTDTPVLNACITQLQEYFAGGRRIFDLPVEQQGTDFQQKVWQQLNTIPFGKTISYLDLSKKIGNTKAIRAVGTSNGSNRIAIIVPCHRVIGSNGSLTGYAGELWRKQWLLEHESKFANGVQTLF